MELLSDMPDESDLRFMRAALSQAEFGLGRTSPNPAVGAVIVRGGRIIARGFHRAAGKPHAEIEAIRALKNPRLANGATLCVTLEPCSTHGRTPPCCDAIIASGITRVVYGATDPNPAHAGRARRILKAARVAVTSGVLRRECMALNEAWNHWITTGLPYVLAKCGMSLDGKITSHPASRWITSAASRADAMRLRAHADAVLVGAETIRADNPKLTVRGIKGARQPWRVIWSKSGNLPADARVFTDRHRDRTLIVTGPLDAVLRALGDQGITSLLVEGGGRTLGEFFDRRLVNKVQFHLAPTLLGGPVPAVGGLGAGSTADALELERVSYHRIGDDIRITGYPRPTPP